MLSNMQQMRIAREMHLDGELTDEEYEEILEAKAQADIDDYESDCDRPEFDEWY